MLSHQVRSTAWLELMPEQSGKALPHSLTQRGAWTVPKGRGKNRGRTIVWEEQRDLLEALPPCLMTPSTDGLFFKALQRNTLSNPTKSLVAGEFSEYNLRVPNASSIK